MFLVETCTLHTSKEQGLLSALMFLCLQIRSQAQLWAGLPREVCRVRFRSWATKTFSLCCLELAGLFKRGPTWDPLDCDQVGLVSSKACSDCNLIRTEPKQSETTQLCDADMVVFVHVHTHTRTRTYLCIDVYDSAAVCYTH